MGTCLRWTRYANLHRQTQALYQEMWSVTEWDQCCQGYTVAGERWLTAWVCSGFAVGCQAE